MQLWLENFLLRQGYDFSDFINIDTNLEKCGVCFKSIWIRDLDKKLLHEYMVKRFKEGDLEELQKNVIKDKADKKYIKTINSNEGIEGFLIIHSWIYGGSYSYLGDMWYTFGLTKKTVQAICRNCSLIGNRNVEDIIMRTIKYFEKNVVEPEMADFASYVLTQNRDGGYR